MDGTGTRQCLDSRWSIVLSATWPPVAVPLTVVARAAVVVVAIVAGAVSAVAVPADAVLAATLAGEPGRDELSAVGVLVAAVL